MHPIFFCRPISGTWSGTVSPSQMCAVHFYVTGVLFVLHSLTHPCYVKHFHVESTYPAQVFVLSTIHVPWARDTLISVIDCAAPLFCHLISPHHIVLPPQPWASKQNCHARLKMLGDQLVPNPCHPRYRRSARDSFWMETCQICWS